MPDNINDTFPTQFSDYENPPLAGVGQPSGLNPDQSYVIALDEEEQAELSSIPFRPGSMAWEDKARKVRAYYAKMREDFMKGQGQYQGMGADQQLYSATPQEYSEATQPKPQPQPMQQQELQPPPVTGAPTGLLQQASQFSDQQRAILGQSAALHRDTAAAIHMNSMAMQRAQQAGIEGIEEYMNGLEDAYTQADAELASLRVDPSKWEKETPVLAQVLMAVAAGAAGFATQGKGPNPVVQMIERAIDRDVNSQMKNIALKIKRSKMKMDKAQQLGVAESALRAAYIERSVSALEAIKMNAQSEQAGLLADLTAAQLGEKSIYQHLDYYDKYISKYLAGEEQGKWDDAVTGRSVVGNAPGVQDIVSLYEQWSSARVGDSTMLTRGSQIVGAIGETVGLGSTGMNEYNAQKQSKVLAIAAEYNKGRPTDKDFEAVSKLLPTSGISPEDGAKRIGKLLTRHYEQLDASFKGLSAADKRKALPAYLDSINKIASAIKQHPELATGVEGKLKKALLAVDQ